MTNNYLNLIQDSVNERNTLLDAFYNRIRNAIAILKDVENAFKTSFNQLGVNYTLQLTETLGIAINKGYDVCFTSCNGYHRHYNEETLNSYIEYGYYGSGIVSVLDEIESLDLKTLESKLNNDLLAIISNYRNETLALETNINNANDNAETDTEEETTEE